MALRIVVLLFILIVGYPAAFAQDDVKRSVFEDCDRARSEYAQLNLEQQSLTLDFLTRVIALNTQSPTAPEAYALAPSSQINGDAKGLSAHHGADLIPGTLWQSTDAKRELRAKRCALDILEHAGSLAFDTVLSLVSTYTQQPLSDEIAVGVEEVTASIAESAHRQGKTLGPERIDALIPHLFGSRSLVARNVIHEYKSETIPSIVSFIARKGLGVKDDKSTDGLTEFLQEIDPDGAKALRAAISLIPSLNSEQIDRLLNNLPFPKAEALSGFLPDLIELSVDPNYSASFTPLLAQACVALGGITIDPSQQQLVANTPRILNSELLTKEQLACLVQSSLPLLKTVVADLGSADSLKQSLALTISLKALHGAPSDIRGEGYTLIKKIATSFTPSSSADPRSSLWQEALLGLATFPERKAETIAVTQELFNSAIKLNDSGQSLKVIEAIFKLLIELNVGRGDPGRFSNFINLALTTPPTPKSVQALRFVSTLKDLPLKSIPSLIELTRYPETIQDAEKGLLTLGKASVATIRKNQSRLPQGIPRLAVSSVILASGAASKAEAYSVAKSLSTLNDCSYLGSNGELLCRLVEQSKDDSELSGILAELAKRCLDIADKESLKSVAKCAPNLIQGSADEFGAALRKDIASEARIEPVIQLALQNLRSADPSGDRLAAQILLNSSEATQRQILNLLSIPNIAPAEVRRAVVDLANDEKMKGSTVYPAILKALAYSGNTEYPWRDFVKEAIEEASKGGLNREDAEVISIIPVDSVLHEVVPALESDNSDRLVGAALIGGALGTRAVPLVSRLWHLRTLRSPAVRYSASLALLEINPLTPDMDETVRRVLVNRFFSAALTTPIKWSNTVAVNDLERSSFGVLRNDRLEKLLALK